MANSIKKVKGVFSTALQPRFNPIGIEMLPDNIYKQVFGNDEKQASPSYYNIRRCMEHLRRHQLIPQQIKTQASDEFRVRLDIPKIEGNNIDEHFQVVGNRFSDSYRQMACMLIESGIPEQMPTIWNYQPGWTRYELNDKNEFIGVQVEAPLEEALVFDIEICLNDSKKNVPTLAVAASSKAWYSWTSPRLTNENCDLTTNNVPLNVNDLINIRHSNQSKAQQLIIGHNVGFDRSFIKNQYLLDETETKFLDTLSLHMCICGLTGLQRAYKCAQKRKIKDGEEISEEDLQNNSWIQESCLNNLADVYEFHCGKQISKDDRQIFVEGSMEDVRQNFQSLVTYCATDVKATFEVFKSLFSTFTKRFPHPVTLAGMLEMSTMYLPVEVNNWNQYIHRSQSIFDDCENRLKTSLQQLANKACSLTDEEIKRDVWLWDLDVSRQKIVPNKSKYISWIREKQKSNNKLSLDDRVQQIYDTEKFMRKVMPFKPGFPKWYRDLCCPINKAESILGKKEWSPGPILITPQMRLTPKLMQMTWDGYPLHFHQEYGWGYLVPNDDLVSEYAKLDEDHPYKNFPIDSLKKLCSKINSSNIFVDDDNTLLNDDLVREKISQLKDVEIGTPNFLKLLKKISKKRKISPRLEGQYCSQVEIPGAYFIRLPHKNGPNYNVGNPLGKDFVSKMEDGTLSSFDNELASLLLKYSSSLSYWKNNHNRIKNQMVVSIETKQDKTLAAILPRVIVAGTVTRRAVEPTWLTASNQDTSRVGSELKAMVQAPPGYSFVGADVDSQELWIASLMGDSYSYRIHGGTGLSYMTLKGSKSEKTDMHSKTASLIGVTRDDAKVLNYARIYGAGQKFIERFLVNTNPQMNPEEAKKKANTMFKETKGARRFYFVSSGINEVSRSMKGQKSNSISINVDMSEKDRLDFVNSEEILTKIRPRNKSDVRVIWEGGTESATFNKLEEIASSPEPRTPVLDCQISKALEPSQDTSNDFVTSRVNWVVQSSAVDFLHLVLVNMKWLLDRLDVKGRFAISIHDEVRYLVRDEDRYKTAFALQVSNLMVRSYFAYKLNMKDLPISVAFFSSVDIDKCLRKEVNMDCKSPSNPNGLEQTYGILPGESLDIKKLIDKYSYTV